MIVSKGHWLLRAQRSIRNYFRSLVPIKTERPRAEFQRIGSGANNTCGASYSVQTGETKDRPKRSVVKRGGVDHTGSSSVVESVAEDSFPQTVPQQPGLRFSTLWRTAICWSCQMVNEIGFCSL